jgi:hypothetical protein
MSLASLFFPTKSGIGQITFDALVSESVQTDADITTNPVESGADVADNIVIQPLSFNVEGIISDTPVNFLGTLIDSVESIITGEQTERPSVKAWEALLKLQSDKKPFTYVNNLKKYENIAIKSLSYTQDKESFNILHFTATLQEVITVASKNAKKEQFKDKSTADMAMPTINRGIV